MNPRVVLSNLVFYSSITDFNECTVRNGMCQQRCINAFGSYRYHKSVILNKKKKAVSIYSVLERPSLTTQQMHCERCHIFGHYLIYSFRP